jgi:hypothetical protein
MQNLSHCAGREASAFKNDFVVLLQYSTASSVQKCYCRYWGVKGWDLRIDLLFPPLLLFFQLSFSVKNIHAVDTVNIWL